MGIVTFGMLSGSTSKTQHLWKAYNEARDRFHTTLIENLLVDFYIIVEVEGLLHSGKVMLEAPSDPVQCSVVLQFKITIAD